MAQLRELEVQLLPYYGLVAGFYRGSRDPNAYLLQSGTSFYLEIHLLFITARYRASIKDLEIQILLIPVHNPASI